MFGAWARVGAGAGLAFGIAGGLVALADILLGASPSGDHTMILLLGVVPDPFIGLITGMANGAVIGFFALTGQHELIGFRSSGADGQVPGGTYDSASLDTGGGLRPDLTGKGLGREAIRTGLAFGREQFAPAAFRVTIATFNARARRVVQSLGFGHVASFHVTTDGRSYEILTRSEGTAPL